MYSFMKRSEQHQFNQYAVRRITKVERGHVYRAPPYWQVVSLLNAEGFTTSRGSLWTRRSLYRMLQREGYRGLHGLFDFKKRGVIWGHYANRVIEVYPGNLEKPFWDILET